MTPILERKHTTDRVRRILDTLGDFRHLEVRAHGAHVVIGASNALFARLTSLGNDTFGLSFRASRGGWEPMLLVDTLDEIVHDMTAAIEAPAA
jgi:hypothetical protein